MLLNHKSITTYYFPEVMPSKLAIVPMLKARTSASEQLSLFSFDSGINAIILNIASRFVDL